MVLCIFNSATADYTEGSGRSPPSGLTAGVEVTVLSRVWGNNNGFNSMKKLSYVKLFVSAKRVE